MTRIFYKLFYFIGKQFTKIIFLYQLAFLYIYSYKIYQKSSDYLTDRYRVGTRLQTQSGGGEYVKK